MEDRFLFVRRNAGAGVVDLQDERAGAVLLLPGGIEVDAAARRRVADCIDEQVGEDAGQPAAIGVNLPAADRPKGGPQRQAFLAGRRCLLGNDFERIVLGDRRSGDDYR